VEITSFQMRPSRRRSEHRLRRENFSKLEMAVCAWPGLTGPTSLISTALTDADVTRSDLLSRLIGSMSLVPVVRSIEWVVVESWLEFWYPFWTFNSFLFWFPDTRGHCGSLVFPFQVLVIGSLSFISISSSRKVEMVRILAIKSGRGSIESAVGWH